MIIAELQREKRASKAPWVKEFGNPSSRENLVMTSPYQAVLDTVHVTVFDQSYVVSAGAMADTFFVANGE